MVGKVVYPGENESRYQLGPLIREASKSRLFQRVDACPTVSMRLVVSVDEPLAQRRRQLAQRRDITRGVTMALEHVSQKHHDIRP